MKIQTRLMPQADSLEVLTKVVEAVSRGSVTYQQIAASIGYDERQGRYYRLAGELLGLLIHEGQNHSHISELGEEYLVSNSEKRINVLRASILKSVFFQRILPFFENSKIQGVSKDSLSKFLLEVTETTASMGRRRASTVISWLKYTQFITEKNDRYFLSSRSISP